MSAIESPSFSRIRCTPCVLRPAIRIFAACWRMIIPSLVTMTTSSVSTTSLIATIFPVLSEAFTVKMPFPPRWLVRYSFSSLRFPKPFCVATRMDVPLRRKFTAPITLSPLPSRIPRTPAAERPIGRISSSWKRIARPFCVPITISCVASVSFTSVSWSPFFRFAAIIPLRRGLLNSERTTFFTNPCSVNIKTKCASSNSLTAINEAIFSFGSLSITLLIDFPFVVLPPSGISNTFNQ